MGNASAIISLCKGAWETKVLSVALEVELFTRISGGAGSVDRLSQESGIDVRLLQMLVNACVGMGLVVQEKETLKNSPDAERFLAKGDSYIGDFIILVGTEYYDVWKGLKEVVMTGRPVRDDRMARLSNPRYAEAHIKAMDGISRVAAGRLSGALDLSGKKSLLEVGGGLGAYSEALTRKNPRLQATLFDSPFSCDSAERRIKESGIKNVRTQPGDIGKGGLPKGHDVIMLTHVLQDMPPEKCEATLRGVYEALPKGGSVVVNEFLLEREGVSPVFSALLSINAFMLSNGGSLHTKEELTEWLKNVGFGGVKAIKTPGFMISLSAGKVR